MRNANLISVVLVQFLKKKFYYLNVITAFWMWLCRSSYSFSEYWISECGDRDGSVNVVLLGHLWPLILYCNTFSSLVLNIILHIKYYIINYSGKDLLLLITCCPIIIICDNNESTSCHSHTDVFFCSSYIHHSRRYPGFSLRVHTDKQRGQRHGTWAPLFWSQVTCLDATARWRCL